MAINSDPASVAPMINIGFGNIPQSSNSTAKTTNIEADATFIFMVVFFLISKKILPTLNSVKHNVFKKNTLNISI